MTEHTDARLEWVLDAIFNQPNTPADDDTRDHAAAAEARRDPEAEMDLREDMHEKGLGL